MRLAPTILAAITLIPVSARGIELALTQWDPGTGPIASSFTVQAVNNLCCGGQSSTLDPMSVPFSDYHLVDSGGVIAETSYLLSDSRIEIGPMNHLRSPRSGAGSNGVVYFSIDEDGAYSLRGDYALSGAQDIVFHANLWDLTAGTFLFESRQVSSATTDQAFALGGTQGDRSNVYFGARDRVVQGGHVYRLIYRSEIGSSESSNGGASASGGITLRVLPEPRQGLPIGIGLLAFCDVLRRSRMVKKLFDLG